MLFKTFICHSLYMWLSSISDLSVSCHFSPNRRLIICKLPYRSCASIKRSSTAKVTKDCFANASIHVTCIFKLLMCTVLKSVPRMLQEKKYKFSDFTFVLSVSLFCFCLFVVSGSYMITINFSFFFPLLVFVFDLLTTLYSCKMYMYFLFIIVEDRILKT